MHFFSESELFLPACNLESDAGDTLWAIRLLSHLAAMRLSLAYRLLITYIIQHQSEVNFRVSTGSTLVKIRSSLHFFNGSYDAYSSLKVRNIFLIVCC